MKTLIFVLLLLSPGRAEVSQLIRAVCEKQAGDLPVRREAFLDRNGVGEREGLLARVRWGADVTAEQKRILSRLIGNMVKVEGGSFRMGTTIEQDGEAYENEQPVHTVELSCFYINKYEVTQAEWKAVMGTNPSCFRGEDLPVEQVRWTDCQEFLRKLKILTGLDFKLPTEAQWEYAARGGKDRHRYKYAGSDKLEEVGWYWKNCGDRLLSGGWTSTKLESNHCRTRPVGGKQPNEAGLYDMSGNVWEWCADYYGEYRSHPQTDPKGPAQSSRRVYRGGGWNNAPGNCRVTNRYGNGPGYRDAGLGFRIAF